MPRNNPTHKEKLIPNEPDIEFGTIASGTIRKLKILLYLTLDHAICMTALENELPATGKLSKKGLL